MKEALKIKTIKSFSVDHAKLTPGMYLSRVDGDVYTYDLRLVKPNVPPYLENAGLHTMEHLLAVYLRNGPVKDDVIYVGPMGCRTGFYFLTRSLPHEKAIEAVREAMKYVSEYEGEIPGATEKQCGNFKEHDLEKARTYALSFYKTLENWSAEKIFY